jgi:hypothetical protein
LTAVALRQLERRPISLREANRFVVAHHRHNIEVRGWLFGSSLWLEEELRAVGIAGQPVGRGMDDGRTLEILRVCTLGDKNACSMLYGALCRAAKALGYERAITYTLASEAGVTPLSAGFRLDAVLSPRESWAGETRHRYDADLFGEQRRPQDGKLRWRRDL